MRILMLEARAVSVSLPDRSRRPLFGQAPLVDILRDIDLKVGPGETVGVVGESGSGKSTLGRTLVGLHAPLRGCVTFAGKDFATLSAQEFRSVRLKIQMIFQDSQSALNPRMKLVDILSAPFLAHGKVGRREARSRSLALLERVGMTAAHGARYPHELSGGQRQRVGIARAIAMQPSFIIGDEIVSGLDVSVQAQILALLRELRTEYDMGLIFISHDLSVVRTLCDRIVVMRQGQIVESGPCAAIFDKPQCEYTRLLLRSIPMPVVESGWFEQVASGNPTTS